MVQKSSNRWFIYFRWKKKDSIGLVLIIFVGLLTTIIGFLYPNFYDIFISLCLGFFIGGFILSFISTLLAQMESNITGAGEIDAEIDIDAEVDVDVDSDVDVDIDSDIDIDIDSDVDVDIDSDVDVDIDSDIDIDIDLDAEVDIDIDSDIDVDTDLDVDSELDIELDGEVDTAISTITPAPIMLLFSTAFLVYGITGLSLFYFIQVDLRFIIFFAAPAISYVSVKIINGFWKLLAKSRYYRISSTRNLIGKAGEVTLKVDERGGVIKIPSNTPMRFERLHVKPARKNSIFERGERVFICDVRNGVLLVDNSKKLIR